VCVGDLHRLENGGEEGKLQPCLSRRRSRSVRTLWYLVLFTSCRSSYCFFSVCRKMMWPSVFTLLYSLTRKACANSRRRHVILSMLLRGSNVSKIPQPIFPGVFLSFSLFLSRSSVRIQTRRPVCTTTSMHSYGVGCNTGLQCRWQTNAVIKSRQKKCILGWCLQNPRIWCTLSFAFLCTQSCFFCKDLGISLGHLLHWLVRIFACCSYWQAFVAFLFGISFKQANDSQSFL
jgi:hypothetical protein